MLIEELDLLHQQRAEQLQTQGGQNLPGGGPLQWSGLEICGRVHHVPRIARGRQAGPASAGMLKYPCCQQAVAMYETDRMQLPSCMGAC